MTTRSTLTWLASIAMLGFVSTGTAAQQPPGAVSSKQVQQAAAGTAAAKPTTREHGQASRAFSAKWATYVQRVYGVPADVWSRRMAPNLAKADAGNLRNAMQRDTFEGAMAEIGGVGAKLSDDKAIDMLAAANGGNPTPQVLGELTNDLVYTPIAPCRIIDTRSTGAGAIAANATRSFVAINSSSFTGQGGSASNCGTLGLNATAVAVNLTAVTPAGAGFATAYPFGTTRPLASSINYTAGAIVNNALIIQIPNPFASSDFSLFTFAQSHFVADIVGYFAPPVATALQCVETLNARTPDPGVVPNGNRNELAPNCPAGYTQTTTNCTTSSWLMPIVFSKDGTCSARNNDSSNEFLSASRTCCRVPGR